MDGKLLTSKGKAVAATTTAVPQAQRVEGWVYREGGGIGEAAQQWSSAQEWSSESGAIAREDIAEWLGAPPRKSLVDNKAPVAGLRLVCIRQHVSTERPFDAPTFRAIHAALGLSKQQEYLTSLKAGACGKHIAAAGNPSEFSSLFSEPPCLQLNTHAKRSFHLSPV